MKGRLMSEVGGTIIKSLFAGILIAAILSWG